MDVGAVHGLLGMATTVALALAAIAALAAAISRRPSRRLVDRLVLVAAGVALLTWLAGTIAILTGAAARDPLHLLYGIGAPVLLLVGRATWRRETGDARWFAAAAVVALLLALRALITSA